MCKTSTYLIDEIKSSLEASPMFNLSLGSKELFHSNFLKWISTVKKNLFQSLIDMMIETEIPEKYLPKIKIDWSRDYNVKREYKNYDLCITVGEGSDEQIILVLENKVKSIPYKNQLDEYYQETPDSHHILLSLASCFPNMDAISDEGNWIMINYHYLSDKLRYLINNENIPINETEDDRSKRLYHNSIIDDYCGFIENLHSLSTVWTDKKNMGSFKDINSNPGILKDLHDKLIYSKWSQDLINGMKLEHYRIESNYGYYFSGNKNEKEINKKAIYINYGYTRAQGLLDVKIKVTEDFILGIQLQGNQYRHVIEWNRIKGKNGHDEYWTLTKENVKIDFFHFDNSECKDGIFPIIGEILAKKRDNSLNMYNKYGDGFLYQYVRIPDTISMESLNDAIHYDIKRIIEQSKYKDNFKEE